NLAICKADHSKKPISSNIKEIIITATNVSVAFQTIPQTSATSEKVTTPAINARTAPRHADHPIPSPFGCLMTKNKVIRNITIAISAEEDINSRHLLRTHRAEQCVFSFFPLYQPNP